jgi:adenylate kinase family enzyme
MRDVNTGNAPTLRELGERICILGPSNSGKSTLAVALASATGLPVVHLDVLRHIPESQWVERPADEFGRLHDARIEDERWVMEGNYSRWLPQRLERATGLIVLDVSTATSLARYIRRTLFERNRRGGLDGVSDRLNVRMISWIVTQTPANRMRYHDVGTSADIPTILLSSARALRRFYRSAQLCR